MPLWDVLWPKNMGACRLPGKTKTMEKKIFSSSTAPPAPVRWIIQVIESSTPASAAVGIDRASAASSCASGPGRRQQRRHARPGSGCDGSPTFAHVGCSGGSELRVQ